jgi:hypothetical protein
VSGIPVDVTSRDARHAERGSPTECVLARNLRAAYGGRWTVTPGRAVRRDGLFSSLRYRVGAAGKRVISRFDSGQSPGTGRVTLHGPSLRPRRPEPRHAQAGTSRVARAWRAAVRRRRLAAAGMSAVAAPRPVPAIAPPARTLPALPAAARLPAPAVARRDPVPAHARRRPR